MSSSSDIQDNSLVQTSSNEVTEQTTAFSWEAIDKKNSKCNTTFTRTGGFAKLPQEIRLMIWEKYSRSQGDHFLPHFIMWSTDQTARHVALKAAARSITVSTPWEYDLLAEIVKTKHFQRESAHTGTAENQNRDSNLDGLKAELLPVTIILQDGLEESVGHLQNLCKRSG